MSSRFTASLLLLAGLAGCSSTDRPSGTLEDVIEAQARVVAIDHAQRLMTLTGDDGVQVQVKAGAEVRNLEQVRAGDKVVVAYSEKVSWQVLPTGTGRVGVSATAEGDRAKAGELPSGKLGRSVKLTASITAIDLENETVTLTGPNGNSLTLRPREPANLRKVKVGDLIDITFSQSLAVGVRRV
jgi:hypothetical protein